MEPTWSIGACNCDFLLFRIHFAFCFSTQPKEKNRTQTAAAQIIIQIMSWLIKIYSSAACVCEMRLFSFECLVDAPANRVELELNHSAIIHLSTSFRSGELAWNLKQKKRTEIIINLNRISVISQLDVYVRQKWVENELCTRNCCSRSVNRIVRTNLHTEK